MAEISLGFKVMISSVFSIYVRHLAQDNLLLTGESRLPIDEKVCPASSVSLCVFSDF